MIHITINYYSSKCRQFQLLWESVPPVNSMSTLLQFRAKQKKLLEELHDLLMQMVFQYLIFEKRKSFRMGMDLQVHDPIDPWRVLALTIDHYNLLQGGRWSSMWNTISSIHCLEHLDILMEMPIVRQAILLFLGI